MRNRSSYFKAYRLKHLDKYREKERIRSLKRRMLKGKPIKEVVKIDPIGISDIKCMANGCYDRNTYEKHVDGYKVWSCVKHYKDFKLA